ncbi:MAG: lcfB 8 [Frankiales bacterium]|nr:lcfB 8 [Frankiales bacterium]
MPLTAVLDTVRERTSTLGTLVQAGLLAALRPDKYVRMAAVVRRQGLTTTTGIALAAVRCPDRVGLVDERGALTWAELDARCDALAVALQARPGGAPTTVAVLARNSRGFVEALAAAGRVGADVLLLNTSFAAPQLAGVLEREQADLLVHDEEFTAAVAGLARDGQPLSRLVAWADGAPDAPTLDALIAEHLGSQPVRSERTGRLVLLTSGTTGTPKGARRPGGGDVSTLVALLERIPWRAEQCTVVAAPMFHAWGFGQLIISATMACTVVMRRRFDPEATLALVQEHGATGLAVVPVMLDRIMDLPEEVRGRYSLASLRFVTASGSRMRPDVVTRFQDRYGDLVYNSYNATEAGMIATATPADLRAAPDTAGRPVQGTHVRIVDDLDADVPVGTVGRIFVRNAMQFEGYTGGETKPFLSDYMSSGDVGRLDEDGRLYVVGRDDEMIVSGGENVYPLEVETALADHPDTCEAAVVGVDDVAFGQRLVAFVVLAPGATAGPDELKQHVREQLAGYKVPREVHLLSELPRNSTGKVVKRELVTVASPVG